MNTQAAVNIWLDSYDDIFSDFDSNSYSEKTLSDDFISQAKKIAINKVGKEVSLRFFIPLNKRNEADEKIISKRLNGYFNKMHQQLKAEIKKINCKGLLLSFVGISLMIVASYISFVKSQQYYVHLLLVFFEPAGWFLLWAGLDNLFYNSKDAKKQLSFYSKMTNATIEFLTLKNDIKK
jgi:hypothetical protein